MRRIVALCVLMTAAFGCRTWYCRYFTAFQWVSMNSRVTMTTRSFDNDFSPHAVMGVVSNELERTKGLLAARAPESEICYETAFRLCEQSGGAFNPRWRGENTIDLGGIDRGFAVDRAVSSTNISFNGDWFIDMDGNAKVVGGEWKIGIIGDAILTLTNSMAYATSGLSRPGSRICDARTGSIVSNNIHSVTVIHPNSAMLADGLSTVCYILGQEEGDAFLAKYYPEAQVIWLTKDKFIEH